MKRKTWFFALTAAVLLTGASACSAESLEVSLEEDRVERTPVQTKLIQSEKDYSESRTKEILLRDESILNNGNSVVRFQGDDYYWKYSSNSVNNDALFANFYLRDDTANDMVCRHSDGTEKVLFSMAGVGEIYLAGGRMYLRAGSAMYSVNTDGSDRRDYGRGKWEGVSPDGAGVIGHDESSIFRVDSQTGEMKVLADYSGKSSYVFVGEADGYLYYSAYDAGKKELTLYQYNLDDSEGIEEADRFILPEDMANMADTTCSVNIEQIIRLGNTLYYSYGFYAGTGGFFQSGGINYAVQDENRNTVNSDVLVDWISAQEFLVEDSQGTVKVYFTQEESGSYIGFWEDSVYPDCMVMDTATGNVQLSDFRLSRPGAAVYLDGAVQIADEHQASYTTAIPESLAAAYGCSEENPETAQVLTLIKNVEIIGNDVYYTAEKSSRNPQDDVGWRPSFVRISSERYKMPIGGEEAELLFSY